MGFLDRLLGRPEPQQQNYQDAPQRPQNADEAALARYRYMLQTAPPEDIERAHAEAFARLTPEQRQMALQQIAQQLPESERKRLTDDPQNLARAATRMEMQRPGAMQQTFGGVGMGGGGGMMGMMAGGLLMSLAGGFIGSSIANSFFSNPSNEQGFQGSPEASGADFANYNNTDYAANDGFTEGIDSSGNVDPYGDPGLAGATDPYGDPGASDSGGFGDFGGDTGGDIGFGDFGGGDGGDFF